MKIEIHKYASLRYKTKFKNIIKMKFKLLCVLAYKLN